MAPLTGEKITIAGSTYDLAKWGDEDVMVSKKGTGYILEPGVHQPVSFPGGTPLRRRGNPVYVLNVGGIIEEVNR